MCKSPVNPQPDPVDPVSPKPVDPIPPKPTTTTAATAITTTTTTTTTTTISSTATISPSPPTPDGYVPPAPPSPGGYVPPAPPPPDVVAEIQKCCQSIFNIPSCNAMVPTEPYIQSCISDAQASGSYVFSDKVKQAYLAKCHTLTDDMIRGTTKEVIDQGTKIKRNMDLGMSLASTVALAKVHAPTLGVRAVLDSVVWIVPWI
ncbi:hypothetical protein BASA83_000041 [Batrachochytrium salamandrivorans]|nr:hypothetical protein BASA83_000041 [Batrachochytrium salamandrivorans]